MEAKMLMQERLLFLTLLLSNFFFFSPSSVLAMDDDGDSNLNTYIVHVQKHGSVMLASADDVAGWHQSFLPVRPTGWEPAILVYSYNSVISGFAARLTPKEVKAMEEKEGFLMARPDRVLKLQTTHSPKFLGLDPAAGVWPVSGFGKGVIVGVFDTGVIPNHPSFAGDGMPPPPAKWKGECEFNTSDCNNKLIGLRGFHAGAASMGLSAPPVPYDDDGHGTHTASTAAGKFVGGADVLGNANGTAVGMAPLAHLAIYKVCYGEDCAESDILAGMDKAVEDGVDVMSLSLGGPAVAFFNDSLAIGAFGAMEKGVLVSCAAGNSGPVGQTLSNEAPWILTVGASTIDRTVRSTVKLGNGDEFHGESLFQPNDGAAALELVYPGGVTGRTDVAQCSDEKLGGVDVAGKIVICDRGVTARIAKGEVVKAAGGAAMILANTQVDGFSTIADPHVLPASHVTFVDGEKIKSYQNSTGSPTASLVFEGTFVGIRPAPVVASFSSRGPSFADPNILKPDIIGPGVSILAAWPFPVGPSTAAAGDSSATFNMESGTSMACPHLSGIAALFKAAHPRWSPAMIKSAIMTTASTSAADGSPILDQNHNPADLFAVGAGHVNPTRASYTGLVYDIKPADYIQYLCGLGYTDTQVSAIARSSVRCSVAGSIAGGELNYPSFSLRMLGSPVSFNRTVTNVGQAKLNYEVEVVAPAGLKVSVEPTKLEFSLVGEKKSYTVTFSPATSSGSPPAAFTAGYIKWVSNLYSYEVRSPISVTFPTGT